MVVLVVLVVSLVMVTLVLEVVMAATVAGWSAYDGWKLLLVASRGKRTAPAGVAYFVEKLLHPPIPPFRAAWSIWPPSFPLIVWEATATGLAFWLFVGWFRLVSVWVCARAGRGCMCACTELSHLLFALQLSARKAKAAVQTCCCIAASRAQGGSSSANLHAQHAATTAGSSASSSGSCCACSERCSLAAAFCSLAAALLQSCWLQESSVMACFGT